MSEHPWTPWHDVVHLREDLKTGELSLSIFAADLYAVAIGNAKSIYQKPSEFFSLTYPTFNLRELAKDVIGRLAGANDKAVLQLELTYGGGKTHALITLYHLVQDPGKLPDLPSIEEFRSHIGVEIPKTRVAIIAFDKLDPVKGMEVKSPDGSVKRFLYPWSVLAYQLAGSKGLEMLGMEGEKERETPPFENVLVDLLKLPTLEGLPTLILIDEVLMWARTKVDTEPVWRHRLQDFFQNLTQAATEVDRCCIVASLLATDPKKSDALGKEVIQELYTIFRREREQGVLPVDKEDVAEILRRRFFTPESIADHESFRQHVVAALTGIMMLDEDTKKRQKDAEKLFLKNYPFHPDLIDVFYTKWTNLEGFQRTRGVLRTFALALRNAEQWDTSPLVGSNAFLNNPDNKGLSEACRELTSIATLEEYEGKMQDWNGILGGELEKAREIQGNFTALNHREIEQAVITTFLHSQPIGRKAQTRDLLLLLGQTRPDRIELERALQQWADTSWFLDEAEVTIKEQGPDGRKLLPRAWRLGSKPNLQQMHHSARENVSPDLITARLLEEIRRLKDLTVGASASGVKVHLLPSAPKEVGDEGDFHYVILGPDAASASNVPSKLAKRFIDEHTSPERPRVFRNAILLVVPLWEGLEHARNQIKDYLGWEEVRAMLKVADTKTKQPAKGKGKSKASSTISPPVPEGQGLDSVREKILLDNLNTSREEIPDSILQMYCIVITVSEKNEIQAFKFLLAAGPLFDQIKADTRSRIQETAISAGALLPGGPYDLWREGESTRRVKDLVFSFAQHPHLPKMLNRSAIAETIRSGCKGGQLILQLPRPDRSLRTFWRENLSETEFADPSLEVTLPENAMLTYLPPSLFKQGILPDLWEGEDLPVKKIAGYFSGTYVAKVQRDTYEEHLPVPHAEEATIKSAVAQAVRSGDLWLINGPISVLNEDFSLDILTEEAHLRSPPEQIHIDDILPPRLPQAWRGESATALTIYDALSKEKGILLPWSLIREALDKAISSGRIELALESLPLPKDFALAGKVLLRLPRASPEKQPPEKPIKPFKPAPPRRNEYIAESSITQDEIQDLVEIIPEIMRAAVGLDLKFKIRIDLTGTPPSLGEAVVKINAILAKINKDLKLES
ncbi:MAG: hypothetical protein RBG13Loki_0616 [Promethearchaeota archaeon CR_4]|nr:MAG: hypothetical protein RBG13Loki_0616 [Candidatus Lokiarchaeota archaeon CR_4]